MTGEERLALARLLVRQERTELMLRQLAEQQAEIVRQHGRLVEAVEAIVADSAVAWETPAPPSFSH